MQFVSIRQIEEDTGIKYKSLLYYIGKDWKPEREARNSELVEALSESKRTDLLEITKYGLTYLKEALKTIQGMPPTPALLKTISTIVFEINKIKALDEGKPTEILAELKPASIIEVRQLLTADPFMEIEHAQIIEKNPETNTSTISTVDPDIPSSGSEDDGEVCGNSDGTEP